MSFAESERLFAEALKVVAGGTTQAKSPENYIPGAYPIYAARGHGAYLWDVDGNRFIDWILAYGTVVLGYTDSEVDEAIRSEEHTSELQSRRDLVCRLLLEKKKKITIKSTHEAH